MLANELGALNVDEMLSQMTPEEFLERVAAMHLAANPQKEKPNMTPADDPQVAKFFSERF